MTQENIETITRLAELKITLDETPRNSFRTLPLANDFFKLYQRLRDSLPAVGPGEIDELILDEMENLKKEKLV